MTHQEKEVNFLLKATGNGYPSHQPSKSEELQPCPFCLGKAQRRLTKVRYDSLHGDPYQDHIVGCFNSNCPVHPAITHCNENCAVTEWNTRHTRQSHQPSKSNEEVAQALMMKTAQQGGLHTRDIIKALQDKDADREKAVEEEQNRILKECFELIEWNKDTKNQWAGIIHANTTINAIQQIVDRVREPLVSGTTPQNISNDK